MSHFAERLMARSRGAPQAAGVSLLVPRRSSLFESPAAIEAPAPVEAEMMAARPAAGSSSPQPPQPPARGQQAFAVPPQPPHIPPVARDEATGHAPRPPLGEQPAVDPVAPAGSAQPQPPAAGDSDPVVFQHRETAADGVVPPPHPAATAVSELPRKAMGEAHSYRRDHRTIDAPQQTAAIPAQAPERRAPPHVERAAQPEPQPAPTISIGRIDVQFLPRDMPKPPTRASAPRSQGFGAYDRARRGEPR